MRSCGSSPIHHQDNSRHDYRHDQRTKLCFGVYDSRNPVAFARAVTDAATFAYLCDLFVSEPDRGRGMETWLVECITRALPIMNPTIAIS